MCDKLPHMRNSISSGRLSPWRSTSAVTNVKNCSKNNCRSTGSKISNSFIYHLGTFSPMTCTTYNRDARVKGSALAVVAQICLLQFIYVITAHRACSSH